MRDLSTVKQDEDPENEESEEGFEAVELSRHFSVEEEGWTPDYAGYADYSETGGWFFQSV